MARFSTFFACAFFILFLQIVLCGGDSKNKYYTYKQCFKFKSAVDYCNHNGGSLAMLEHNFQTFNEKHMNNKLHGNFWVSKASCSGGGCCIFKATQTKKGSLESKPNCNGKHKVICEKDVNTHSPPTTSTTTQTPTIRAATTPTSTEDVNTLSPSTTSTTTQTPTTRAATTPTSTEDVNTLSPSTASTTTQTPTTRAATTPTSTEDVNTLSPSTTSTTTQTPMTRAATTPTSTEDVNTLSPSTTSTTTQTPTTRAATMPTSTEDVTTLCPSTTSTTTQTPTTKAATPTTEVVSTKSPSTTSTTTQTSTTRTATTPTEGPETTQPPTTKMKTGTIPGNTPTREPGDKNKQTSTGKTKTETDKKVDDFVKKLKEVNVEDSDSLEEVLSMTTSLVKDLKRNRKEKGNVIKATLTVEAFGLDYARYHFNMSNTTTRTLKKSEGFILEMVKVVGKERFIFPRKNHQSSDKIEKTTIDLPDVLFDGQDHYVVNALFTDVSENIPKSDEGQKEIISPIISSTLDPKPDAVLKENVTITLKNFKKPTGFRPSCVFWDVTAQSDLGGDWSTRGCTVIQSNEIRTVCSCNHLTSFALLMQVDDTPSVDYQHSMALSYITYIGCAFSLLGEALTVLAYFVLMNMKQEQCQIRVNLAISLAVAQIFFLSGITATSNPGVCTFVGVMLHYFYLVAFGWMMLEGVYLYLMVVKVFNTIVKMKLYYIFAWGFPVIAVGISLAIAATSEDGINSYTHENFCWVSFSNGLIWAFVVPVLLISLANVVILIFVVREMTRLNQANTDNIETFRRNVKACVVLFPLLGLTWVFGLLSVTNAGIFFQYVFTILNSFQGFLIFVLHCLRSGEIRASCQRKLQRMELLNSSNFSSSKSATSDSFVSGSGKKRPAAMSASTDSLQSDTPRRNKVSPNNMEMDNQSIRTCVTPIDI